MNEIAAGRLSSTRSIATWSRLLGTYGVWIALAALLLVALVTAPEFFGVGNLQDVLRSASILGIVTMGQVLVLMTAGLAYRALGSRTKKASLFALWPWVVGGAVGASGYVFYSLAIFGEIASPYRYEFDENFRTRMQQGLMGAGWPSLRVISLITWHPFRGLFFWFPATALAIGGLFLRLMRRDRVLLCVLSLVFFLGLR